MKYTCIDLHCFEFIASETDSLLCEQSLYRMKYILLKIC